MIKTIKKKERKKYDKQEGIKFSSNSTWSLFSFQKKANLELCLQYNYISIVNFISTISFFYMFEKLYWLNQDK